MLAYSFCVSMIGYEQEKRSTASSVDKESEPGNILYSSYQPAAFSCPGRNQLFYTIILNVCICCVSVMGDIFLIFEIK